MEEPWTLQGNGFGSSAGSSADSRGHPEQRYILLSCDCNYPVRSRKLGLGIFLDQLVSQCDTSWMELGIIVRKNDRDFWKGLSLGGFVTDMLPLSSGGDGGDGLRPSIWATKGQKLQAMPRKSRCCALSHTCPFLFEHCEEYVDPSYTDPLSLCLSVWDICCPRPLPALTSSYASLH